MLSLFCPAERPKSKKPSHADVLFRFAQDAARRLGQTSGTLAKIQEVCKALAGALEGGKAKGKVLVNVEMLQLLDCTLNDCIKLLSLNYVRMVLQNIQR